jgi:hypothetical protein
MSAKRKAEISAGTTSRKRRTLPPALRAYSWKKGESGNPGGIGGNYHKTMMLFRDYSPDAAQRLIEVAELDAASRNEDGSLRPLSNHADRRLVTVAASHIIERAWGKPKEYDPKSEQPEDKGAFNPDDFSLEELDEIEPVLRLMVERAEAVRASKAGRPQAEILPPERRLHRRA